VEVVVREPVLHGVEYRPGASSLDRHASAASAASAGRRAGGALSRRRRQRLDAELRHHLYRSTTDYVRALTTCHCPHALARRRCCHAARRAARPI